MNMRRGNPDDGGVGVFSERTKEDDPNVGYGRQRSRQEQRADDSRARERSNLPEQNEPTTSYIPKELPRVKSSNPIWVRQKEGYDHMFVLRDTKANMKRCHKSDQCRENKAQWEEPGQRAGDCPCPESSFRQMVREVYSRGETVGEMRRGLSQEYNQGGDSYRPQPRSYPEQPSHTSEQRSASDEDRLAPEQSPHTEPHPCPERSSRKEPRPHPEHSLRSEPRAGPDLNLPSEGRPCPGRMIRSEARARLIPRYHQDPRPYPEPGSRTRYCKVPCYPLPSDMSRLEGRHAQVFPGSDLSTSYQWHHPTIQCTVCKKTFHKEGHIPKPPDEPNPNSFQDEVSLLEKSSQTRSRKKTIPTVDKATQTKRKRKSCCC